MPYIYMTIIITHEWPMECPVLSMRWWTWKFNCNRCSDTSFAFVHLYSWYRHAQDWQVMIITQIRPCLGKWLRQAKERKMAKYQHFELIHGTTHYVHHIITWYLVYLTWRSSLKILTPNRCQHSTIWEFGTVKGKALYKGTYRIQ
jgi:hypothetical protein